MTATLEDQAAAWEAYRLAKFKADRSCDFQDSRAAEFAYREFCVAFVGEPSPSPVDQQLYRNVVIFPAHKARSSGGSRHDERRS